MDTPSYTLFGNIYAVQYDYVRTEEKCRLTGASIVHSNEYGLDNICWIKYLTAVDPFNCNSSAVQTYQHLTCACVEIFKTVNFTSIGKNPPPFLRRLATRRLVSHAEQGIIPFSNILQGHTTVVLVCCISEWEPDITCTWEVRRIMHSNTRSSY